MSALTDRVRAQLAHAKEHRMVAVAIDCNDVEQLLADLREAERYIAQLRVPLLYEWGTTDPDLLSELWDCRPTLADAMVARWDRRGDRGPLTPTIGDPT